ncbi:MAG: 6-carboxytetrahydropterin synthase QueD [Bryobacterales bacterium]|nr:6-carboxytetrahydropterin synthase QueD [Bryobacterales bacterium]
MYEVVVEKTFAAGHALRHYKGKCENVHGHNYRVQVTIEGEKLNAIGLLVDFVELKRVLMEVVDYLDHKFLNDIPPFIELNPSAENMARYFHDEIMKSIERIADVPVRLREVRIWETDTSIAAYRG